MTATVLTRDDILALRKSTGVAFHYHEGSGYLRVYFSKGGDPVIYSATEQRLYPKTHDVLDERFRNIDTDTTVYGYAGEGFAFWDLESNPKASAFYLIHHNRPEHVTIFELLRPGDTLTLKWLGSNNSDNVRSAGFHRDELRLTVTRGDKTMIFLIAAETGPDNSARMVRKDG